MSGRIKVGLVGIGNCFSGLIQGIEYYRCNPDQHIIGIIHKTLAGYGIHDIDFVCGFDVGENKVGRTINEAIYAYPNMVDWIPQDGMPKTEARVHESPALDGVGIWVENRINPCPLRKDHRPAARGGHPHHPGRLAPRYWYRTCRWAPRRQQSSGPRSA